MHSLAAVTSASLKTRSFCGTTPALLRNMQTSTIKPLFGAQADAGDVAGSLRQPSWSANLSSRVPMAAEQNAAARAQRDGSQAAAISAANCLWSLDRSVGDDHASPRPC